MQAGKLRHVVTIQTASESQDSFGEPIKTWGSNSTAWASIQPLSGRELLTAQQYYAEATHRVIMRHSTAITPAVRLKFGTRYLQVNSVSDRDERGEQVECICTEVV